MSKGLKMSSQMEYLMSSMIQEMQYLTTSEEPRTLLLAPMNIGTETGINPVGESVSDI